jgi:hypothetical protein
LLRRFCEGKREFTRCCHSPLSISLRLCVSLSLSLLSLSSFLSLLHSFCSRLSCCVSLSSLSLCLCCLSLPFYQLQGGGGGEREDIDRRFRIDRDIETDQDYRRTENEEGGETIIKYT